MQRRPFDKYLDRGTRLWIAKTARKNYWRVAAWHDLDDLIQEGYMAFAICRQRYSDRVENRRHFMALVKVVYIQRITDMAAVRSRQTEVAISQVAQPGHELDALEMLGGGEEGDAELAALIGSASKEIRLLLATIATPAGQDRLRRPSRLSPAGIRETTNERLCRMIGVDPFDLEGALRALLKPGVDQDWQWANFFRETFAEMKDA